MGKICKNVMANQKILITKEQIAFFCLHIESDVQWQQPQYEAAMLWAMLRDSALYKTFSLSDLYPDREKIQRILAGGGSHLEQIKRAEYHRGYDAGVMDERQRRYAEEDANRRTADEALKIANGITFAAERTKLDEALADFEAKYAKLQRDIRAFNKAASRINVQYDPDTSKLTHTSRKSFTNVGGAMKSAMEQ